MIFRVSCVRLHKIMSIQRAHTYSLVVIKLSENKLLANTHLHVTAGICHQATQSSVELLIPLMQPDLVLIRRRKSGRRFSFALWGAGPFGISSNDGLETDQ